MVSARAPSNPSWGTRTIEPPPGTPNQVLAIRDGKLTVQPLMGNKNFGSGFGLGSEAALPTPHGEQERCAHPRTAWNPRLPTPHGEQERRNPVSADADPALPPHHGQQEPRCVPDHQGVRTPESGTAAGRERMGQYG